MSRQIKIVFAVAFVAVSLGLFFSLRYGVAPRPVPLIKATEVSSIKEAGVLSYRRMRQEVRSKNIVVAGLNPLVPNYVDFWQGFVLASRDDGSRYDKVLTSPELPLFLESKVMEIEESDDLIQTGLGLNSKETKTLLYTDFNSSTHLNDESLSSAFEKVQKDAVIITQHRFWPTREMTKGAALNCDDQNPPEDVFAKLDCLAEFVSRQHFRKNLDPSKSYVALYRFGRQDYVVFYHQGSPQKAN